jgi:hypothetical protein
MRIHPLSGGQSPNKDAAGHAYSSTQPSSTLPWGATLVPNVKKITHLGDAAVFDLDVFYNRRTVGVHLSAWRVMILWKLQNGWERGTG